jgi:hypothetical protein
MNDLLSILSTNQIDILPKFNGVFLRSGKNNILWFIGQEIVTPGGKLLQWASFGNWSTGLKESWSNVEDATLTIAEQAEFKKIKAETERKLNEEKRWREEQAAIEAQGEWENFSTCGESPYFARKGHPGLELYGCRLEPHVQGARTIVPIRDGQGKLWSYQRIYSEKLSGTGRDKVFKKGARFRGDSTSLDQLALRLKLSICAKELQQALLSMKQLDALLPSQFVLPQAILALLHRLLGKNGPASLSSLLQITIATLRLTAQSITPEESRHGVQPKK